MARRRSKTQDVRTATWNVSSMVSRSGDALHRRKIDFCCAQEMRWRGESVRMLGANGRRYKFFWQGCNKGTAGVGVFIAERWIDSVVNVVRVNERIMYAGCAFSGRPLAWGRLEMLVGYWKEFQWSPTGRVEIQLTILWW